MIGEIERAHIAAAKAYGPHGDPSAARRRLADFVTAFYARIRAPVPVGLIERLADPTRPVIEMAHDGQLPHLGIVRSVLKADEIAAATGGVCLYLIGNHYTSAMKPRNLHLGMPLRGVPPEKTKSPLRVSVGGASEDVPFKLLPTPAREQLDELEARAADYLTNNAAYERSRGIEVSDLGAVEAKMAATFGVLRTVAGEVGSFGDWLIRVQHDLLDARRSLPVTLFAPFGDLHLPLRQELAAVMEREPETLRLKASVSQEQRERGEKPYATLPVSSGWLACPRCGNRAKMDSMSATAIRFKCPRCGQAAQGPLSEFENLFSPDIVLFELMLFQAGLHGWVVGSRAAYHPVIEAAHRQILGGEMPPKFLLASVPRFRGIGDPPEGYGRTRLVRALFEIDVHVLCDALQAPWPEDPSVRSPHLPN